MTPTDRVGAALVCLALTVVGMFFYQVGTDFRAMKKLKYSVGQCYANYNYSTILKISKIGQHGIFFDYVKRDWTYSMTGKIEKVSKGYLEWDTLPLMSGGYRKVEVDLRIDCEMYDQAYAEGVSKQ